VPTFVIARAAFDNLLLRNNSAGECRAQRCHSRICHTVDRPPPLDDFVQVPSREPAPFVARSQLMLHHRECRAVILWRGLFGVDTRVRFSQHEQLGDIE
jgi:hypothetical protein